MTVAQAMIFCDFVTFDYPAVYSNQSKSAAFSLGWPLLLAYMPMYAPTNPPATSVLRMRPSAFSSSGFQASAAVA